MNFHIRPSGPAFDEEAVAKALGGRVVSPGKIAAPGPGRGRLDTSLSVQLSPIFEHGFVCLSAEKPNDRTWQAECREHVRKKLADLALPRTRITAKALKHKTFEPVRWIVPGFIPEGLTLFAGRPKLGKSWLVLDIAVAVARGGGVLGDIQCEQGDVLYAALEDNEGRLQGRMEKIIPPHHEEDWPEALEFETSMPKLNEGGLDMLRSWIFNEAEKPRLIIIDTLAKVKPGASKNEYASDYAVVGELQKLAAEARIAIILVTHTRKMEASDPIDGVSGTLGLSGAADTILVLNRKADGVTLYGRGRDIEEIETAMQFDRDTCRWRVLGEVSEVRRSDERQQILSTLEEADGTPLTPSEIADETGFKPVNVRNLLRKMVKAGEVAKSGKGYVSTGDAGHTVTSPASDTAPPPAGSVISLSDWQHPH